MDSYTGLTNSVDRKLGTQYMSLLLFEFLTERSHCIAQAGLQLLSLSPPPISTSSA